MTDVEQRIATIEAQNRQSARDLSVVSQAMAEFLAWTQETETNGIKAGTLITANGIVRMGHLKTEASTLRLTLEQLNKGMGLANIRSTLEQRIQEIESQIESIGVSCG